MKRIGIALALFVFVTDGGTAQPLLYGDTIVEVLGLRTWTPSDVEAAVKRYAPNVSLASAGCAVILRDSVGFADAAVMVYSSASDTVWTIIRVVEPTDSALVQYTKASRTPIPLPGRWAALDSALAAEPRLVSYFQHADFVLDGADSVFNRAVPAGAHDLRKQLLALSSDTDRRAATDLLKHSSNANARQLAALVATNFAAESEIWHALVEGLRAGSDHGASMAQMVFRGLARSGRFSVNWAPAGESLSALIGGTNLFGYDAVLSGLVETDISPALARTLTRVNPELLADHAVALNPYTHPTARRFLMHAGAPDEGYDRAQWIEWIRQK